MRRAFRLLFVGGAFGAGKSTLCQAVARALPARHVKASELLQFQPQPNDSTGKAVVDVFQNQERLVGVVDALRVTPETILLDGHFCLWDSGHSVVPVPVDIFYRINPLVLVLVEAASHEVATRLRQRDGRRVDEGLLGRLLSAESGHAHLVAKTLGIPLLVADGSFQAGQLEDQLRVVLGGHD